MSSSLKILDAEIKNFKSLKQTEVQIDGKSLRVVGPNGAGKSSFLQAILSPFIDEYKPLEPIKKGEERASTKVVIGGNLEGEDVEYTIETYYSPAQKKGRLRVLDKDGQQIKSPKSALDAIVGDISFDIDKFLALARTKTGGHSKEGIKKQIEMLKKFMPREVQKKLLQMDVDRKEIYDQRTEVNAEVKFMEGNIGIEYTDEEIEKYSERIDEEAIQNKISDIGKAIEEYSNAEIHLDELSVKLTDYEYVIHNKDKIIEKVTAFSSFIDTMSKYKNEQDVATMLVHIRPMATKVKAKSELLLEAVKELSATKEKVKKGKIWFEKNNKPSTESLMDELKAAQLHNMKYEEILKIKNYHLSIRDKKKEADNLTKKIDAIIAKKKKLFADNPLPVKDLTFTEEQVLYKELPFNEEQHPSSTIIAVGLRIAMAMNPNLKVVVVKDGSLLDKKLYNGILKMCEKEGFQLIVEVVDWDGKELEIKFAEEEL